MSLTIGRVGTDGITLQEASQIDIQGDQLTVSGKVHNLASQSDWVAFRDQIRGLSSNPDETVVPFTSSYDTSLNGYYGVVNSTASNYPDQTKSYWMDWSVQLQRVPDYSLPGLESRLAFASRSYLTGLGVSAQTWWAVPDAVTETVFGPVNLTRATDDGHNVNVWTSNSWATLVPYALDPSYYYRAACKAEYQYGSNWRTLTDRFIPLGGTAATSVRFGNGLIRATLGGSTTAQLSTQVWYSGAYSTAKTWNLYTSGSGLNQSSWTSVSMVTNTPHLQRWRAVANENTSGAAGYPVWVDVCIRRGAPFIEFVLNDAAEVAVHGWKRASVEAGSSITGGIRATSNDSDGHRYVLAGGAGLTKDTTNGAIYSSGTYAFPMMIGYEIAGTSAVAGNSASDVVAQYAGNLAEHVTVVAR